MSDLIMERVSLKGDILDGKVTVLEVKERLQKLEETYGVDIYLPYKLNKKEKPWTMEYLRELELQSMGGASSKESATPIAVSCNPLRCLRQLNSDRFHLSELRGLV